MRMLMPPRISLSRNDRIFTEEAETDRAETSLKSITTKMAKSVVS